ncbi:hypothetical protein BFU36_07285 [Sulfolobus sp. A20]|uniref:helix-turn-helix domain-containing protein n=2 Tax=Sulfolobaceae TaxID=118883 RepID=UPI000845C0EC|nr:helix-turn-helix domain-containing protein [Sulfolobus sp. A20]TRM74576.1 hypothetical protein DJ532_12510 [Sulfolobus sp. A20-N-F8]TRM76615.1 hypothetical protein DJ528_08020 [Sulfolobus sp. B5]TRM80116.1 hypothetical protein DJ524_08625 [Sulfolobus sp. D5]TRM82182.1 hypothetical protein DJ531_09840 [Sulfolobus sp. A20-N-F6]TRM86538.1 hypothetical protein DJ529_11090 [Sulfolobus sp. C3]TRM98190.1 hypothetical protein DJ530_11465 [Sulfolobus sp. E1]TRM98836.1 hypothetical protein DJ527_09
MKSKNDLRDQEYYLYRLELSHDDCWSYHINGEYIDSLIGFYSYGEHLEAFRIAKVERNNIIDGSFMSKSFREKFGIKTVTIRKLNKNLYLLHMIVPYEYSSIVKLYRSGINDFSQLVINNHEIFYFISNDIVVKNLITVLTADDNLRVLDIRRTSLTVDNLFSLMPLRLVPVLLFTRRERDIVLKALNGGYFEIPRKISLDELCKEIGISKTEVTMLIRNSIKKLLNSMFHTVF